MGAAAREDVARVGPLPGRNVGVVPRHERARVAVVRHEAAAAAIDRAIGVRAVQHAAGEEGGVAGLELDGDLARGVPARDSSLARTLSSTSESDDVLR